MLFYINTDLIIHYLYKNLFFKSSFYIHLITHLFYSLQSIIWVFDIFSFIKMIGVIIFIPMFWRDKSDPFVINNFDYLIVDTDVGGDDCQALVLLFHMCKKYNKKLLGITSCNGNAVIDDVVTNILITQTICKVSYPVYKGNDCAMSGQNIKDHFFGTDGFGERQKKYLDVLGQKLDRSLVQEKKAYRFIAESANEYKGKIALICLGPLGNLALAYHYDPSICNYFTNISIMGASDTLAGLNHSYSAQFNIGLDPQAAYIVFNRFRNIILASLDTTIIGLDQESLRPLFLNECWPKGALIKDLYTYMSQKPNPNPPTYCDPVSVLVLFRPDSVVCGMNVRMEIETKGKRSRGATVIDYFGPERDEWNVFLIKDLDSGVILQESEESYKE